MEEGREELKKLNVYASMGRPPIMAAMPIRSNVRSFESLNRR
jgi:hypothetical protein